MTNTNWQGYAGETTLRYFVQMIGLAVQNFVSAATGIAVLLALIRGLSRKTTDKLGEFLDRPYTIRHLCSSSAVNSSCNSPGRAGCDPEL